MKGSGPSRFFFAASAEVSADASSFGGSASMGP